MKNGLHRHEHWITAGLIAVAIMLLSYAQLQAGTATKWKKWGQRPFSAEKQSEKVTFPFLGARAFKS